VANDKKVFPLEYRDKKIYKGKEIPFDRSAHDLASDNPGVPVFKD
jgi:hypothetical protein